MSKISTNQTAFLSAVAVEHSSKERRRYRQIQQSSSLLSVSHDLTSGFENAMNFASCLRNQIPHRLFVLKLISVNPVYALQEKHTLVEDLFIIFRHLCFQMQHMHRRKHLPPEPCPCLFSDPHCGWGGGRGARSICGAHFLSQSSAFLFQVFIRLKSRATHCFPLTLGREQKRIKKENRGRWLSNYKQLARLMHCVMQRKGQYPESYTFLQ